MPEQGPFNYQKSWSCEKPGSENHQWSYRRACEAAQADIEVRWGVDYRITRITFTDNGRTTQTSHKWTCERRWRCTHTVTAVYHIEHRGSLDSRFEQDRYSEKLEIIYEMLNEFHRDYQDKSEHMEFYQIEGS